MNKQTRYGWGFKMSRLLIQLFNDAALSFKRRLSLSFRRLSLGRRIPLLYSRSSLFPVSRTLCRSVIYQFAPTYVWACKPLLSPKLALYLKLGLFMCPSGNRKSLHYTSHHYLLTMSILNIAYLKDFVKGYL